MKKDLGLQYCTKPSKIDDSFFLPNLFSFTPVIVFFRTHIDLDQKILRDHKTRNNDLNGTKIFIKSNLEIYENATSERLWYHFKSHIFLERMTFSIGSRKWTQKISWVETGSWQILELLTKNNGVEYFLRDNSYLFFPLC